MRTAGLNPLVHYLEHGDAEGRDPSRGFNTRRYLANNKDVAASGVNPLVHYLTKGMEEGRAAWPSEPPGAMDGARASVAKLIPVAEETKVVIALENVWNNFCVTPALAKWLTTSFQSPWVKFYFDVGNHVKYITPPEKWIRELGPLVAKVHIKDYKLAPDGKSGNWAKVGEGSVDWPAVRQALEDVGYNGWLTDESRGLPLKELSKRFDLIIAGKNPAPTQ